MRKVHFIYSSYQNLISAISLEPLEAVSSDILLPEELTMGHELTILVQYWTERSLSFQLSLKTVKVLIKENFSIQVKMGFPLITHWLVLQIKSGSF